MDVIEISSFSLVTSSLIVIATVLFFNWFSKQNHDYWKKRGVPFAKPLPFFGSVLDLYYTPSPYLEMKLYSELGPVYGYFERNRPCLTIGDPKILKNILVKDFPFFSTRREFTANNEILDSMLTVVKGEDWKRIRTIVSPTLTTGKIKKMFSIIDECTKTVLQNLQTASQQGNQINAKRVFGAFTMDVIASSAFSTKIDSHNDPENSFVSAAKTFFQTRSQWRYLAHLLFPDLMTFLRVSMRTSDIHFFLDATSQIIEERKRTVQTRNDFLQLLIDTTKELKEEDILKNQKEEKENEDVSNYVGEVEQQTTSKHTSYKKLTASEVVGQCVIFFLAGYETTAATLSAAAYCLALDGGVQDKLRREIDGVLAQHKGELTYEAIQEMKYLDNVISEVLRLFPPLSRYGKWNHDYWKKRGVPFMKPVPFFGSIFQWFCTPLPYLEVKAYSELGCIYGHFERNRPYITIGDPKVLKSILVTDFSSFSTKREFSSNNEVIDSMLTAAQGEQWKRIRAIVGSTLTSCKIKKMFSIIDECTKTLHQNLLKISQQGGQINAKRTFGAFSMDMIARTSFSTKIDSQNDPDNPFVTAGRIVSKKRWSWRYLIHILFPSLSKLLGVSFRTIDINFFKNVTLQIIEERKRTGQTRNDFLQLLINTTKEMEEEEISKNSQRQENGEIANCVGEDGETPAPKNKSFKKLTANEMVGQCIIFFVTGYSTTSSVLSAAAYCLAINEEVQDKLLQEIDKVLGKHKGELTYEAIQEMKYLDNVISEVLRLFPQATRVERIAAHDYQSPDLPFTIPKGMVVGVPIYAMHRDPRHFPDPEKFDPNRFSPEEKAKRDPFAYLPFFAGPRNCVAMRFTLLVIKVCIVRLISAFRIKRCPQTKVPLEYICSNRITTPKEIIVVVEPRKEAASKQEVAKET